MCLMLRLLPRMQQYPGTGGSISSGRRYAPCNVGLRRMRKDRTHIGKDRTAQTSYRPRVLRGHRNICCQQDIRKLPSGGQGIPYSHGRFPGLQDPCYSRGLLMTTLNEVPIGEMVTISKVNAEGSLRRRIMDMGLTKGCVVEVRKVAPLGDPIEICLRGYELSIRKSEAEAIDVE